MKKIILFLSLIIFVSCKNLDLKNEILIVKDIHVSSIRNNRCTYTVGHYTKGEYTFKWCYDLVDEIGKFEIGDTLIIIKK